jgi:lipid-A-disaccharide synthase
MGAAASDQTPPFATTPSLLRIMIVAGEASGDKHGGALARSLLELFPQTRFEMFGSGGDEMRRAGVETLVDAREVAIIGVPEIIRALGKLFRAYRALVAAARNRKPDVIVLVDWPDFNMRLARRLHRDGFKIAYYISPQVWAWRRHRIRAIRRDIDRMLVILPFEEEFYRDAGVDVEYVGHPLLESAHATASREEFCQRHNLDPARPIIALLPGSRKKEIHYHLPAMLEAAGRLRTAECGVQLEEASAENSTILATPQSAIRNPQFAIPLASTVDPKQIDQILNNEGNDISGIVRLIEGDTFNTLFHSSFSVVASGTATVEAALAGTPMIIVYRASGVNWRLIRPLINLDIFGMVNLIAGRQIVPELIQHAVTGEKIADSVATLLRDPARLARMKADLAEVTQRLRAGGGSASHRAASAVMRLVSLPQPHAERLE